MASVVARDFDAGGGAAVALHQPLELAARLADARWLRALQRVVAAHGGFGGAQHGDVVAQRDRQRLLAHRAWLERLGQLGIAGGDARFVDGLCFAQRFDVVDGGVDVADDAATGADFTEFAASRRAQREREERK